MQTKEEKDIVRIHKIFIYREVENMAGGLDDEKIQT